MQPTPSKFKKFLVPGVIIIGLVLVGVLLFMKGGTIDQGAALFNATTKTASIKTGVTGTLNPNTQPLPCLVGSTVPQIKVMSPNGGEVFTAGQQITVKWSTCNYATQVSIALAYYPAGSTNYTHASNMLSSSTGMTANDGSEVVTLPSTALLTANGSQFGAFYKVIVFNGGSPQTATVKDVSDNVFTINALAASLSNTGWQTSGSNGTATIDFFFTLTADTDDIEVVAAGIAANDVIAKSLGATVSTPSLTRISGNNVSIIPGGYLVQEGNTVRFRVRYMLTGASGDYAEVAISSIAGAAIPIAHQTSPTVIIP